MDDSSSVLPCPTRRSIRPAGRRLGWTLIGMIGLVALVTLVVGVQLGGEPPPPPTEPPAFNLTIIESGELSTVEGPPSSLGSMRFDPEFDADFAELPWENLRKSRVAPGETWPLQNKADRLVTKYADVLRQLHDLAARPQDDARRASIGDYLPFVEHPDSPFDRARNLLVLEALSKTHRQDATGALHTLNTLKWLAGQFDYDSDSLSLTYRVETDGMVAALTARLLSVVPMSAEQLSQAATWPDTTDYRAVLQRTVAAESTQRIANFDAYETANDNLPLIGVLTRNGDVALFKRVTAEAMKSAQNPFPQGRLAVLANGSKLDNLAQSGLNRYRYGRSAVNFHMICEVFNLAALGQTRVTLVNTLTAVERFRQRHGKLPESLAQLVPDDAPEVPRDPFDGEPLRYQPHENYYVVYSVGVDGIDQGGAGETMPDIPLRVDLRPAPTPPPSGG